jgi:hypothetical protein
MPSEHLATYLNDHLAGAVAALEMLSDLADAHADLVDLDAVQRVRDEVEEDQALLKDLMTQLRITHSRSRRVMGWLAERATQLKLAVDDSHDGALRAFETVQLISLGIEGKIALWRSLSAVAPGEPILATLDYDTLIARARGQRALLEPLHAATAVAALT